MPKVFLFFATAARAGRAEPRFGPIVPALVSSADMQRHPGRPRGVPPTPRRARPPAPSRVARRPPDRRRRAVLREPSFMANPS
ncbi:hypothetical protein [Burkholderia plantarii]|uniref:hypothetical protein n=1 Tax=Burkholderia plantarii TaxID=41899 RepID=UPI0018DB2E28|nr:hypothetical protein [Burkholderia plantarii]